MVGLVETMMTAVGLRAVSDALLYELYGLTENAIRTVEGEQR